MTTTMGGAVGLGSEPAGRGWRAPAGTIVELANARSAIHWLLDHLRPRRVFAPDYVCRSALEPALLLGAEVRLLAVDDRLAAHVPDDLAADDLVHVVDHFGFRTSPALEAAARAAGATLLRDAAMTLWPTAPADAVVLSPRKVVGVADGGILVDRTGLVPIPDVWVRPDPVWWANARAAVAGRARHDRGLDGGPWFDAFRRAEGLQPLGVVPMSSSSRRRLARMDAAFVAERRRENYDALHDLLGDLALLGPRPADVVPSHFPVVLACRDRVRERLFAADVFPAVHWDMAHLPHGPVHRVAREIAGRVLSLPVDHRLGPVDMRRCAGLVREAISSAGPVASAARG